MIIWRSVLKVMEYFCKLDPDTGANIKIYLFKNVKNTDLIKDNVIKGIWKCIVIKPSLVLDLFQVAVAVNKALVSEQHKTMVTRTIPSEVLFNLSISKNISQSLCTFGVDKETNMLVCFIIKDNLDESSEVLSEIKGESIPISELNSFTDITKIKNVYKINSNDLSKNDLLNIIASKISTKHILSH